MNKPSEFLFPALFLQSLKAFISNNQLKIKPKNKKNTFYALQLGEIRSKLRPKMHNLFTTEFLIS